MKRLMALFVMGVLVACSGASIVTASATEEPSAAAPTVQTAVPQSSESGQVYLVPGEGGSVSGATKLTDSERAALFLETDGYYAGNTGETLPAAITTRTAKDGGELTFNGWWGIVDATVTYFTEVPAVTETFYLYADFRADLSQPMEPVKPTNDVEVLANYIEITRGATGKTETIGLYVSATEVPNAVGSTHYGGPVQFYNEWFELSPGDSFKVFVSCVFSSPAAGAQQCPRRANNAYSVQLESSGTNSTGNIITATHATESFKLEERYFICKASAVHNYRMYIKFYDAGGTMTVYMQAMD